MTVQPLLSPGLRAMALAALSFSAMTVLVKLLGARLPVFEIVLARGVVTLVLTTVAIYRRGLPFHGERRALLWLRGIVGVSALLCTFYALSELPLAVATVLHYTNPVFTGLLGAVFLSEALSRRHVAGLGVCLLGVAFVVDLPQLVKQRAHVAPAAVAIGVCGALLSAGAYTLVRYLRKTEDALVTVFYFALATVLVSLPLTLTNPVTPRGIEWVLLLGVGITTQLGQVFLTRSLYLEPAGRAVSISFLQVLLAFVWGVAVFAETPNTLGLVGATLVLTGIGLVARAPEAVAISQPR